MRAPIKQLLDDPAFKGRLKVVYKHFPLGFHKQAMPAALATVAAMKQGKFWEMHDKIFDNLKSLADSVYEKYARELGLDVDKFNADFKAKETLDVVKQDQLEAQLAGVKGTPSFYFNGRKWEGGMDPGAIKTIVLKNFPKK